MSAMTRIWSFDWSRYRDALFGWWLLCGVQAVVPLLQFRAENISDVPEIFEILSSGSYLVLAILVGIIVQAAHPGRPYRFFQARPVGSGALWQARLLWICGVLLLPLYLAQLAPLIWVEPAWGPVSAFSVHFWALHLSAVCGLAAIAAASPKLSSYLLRALFGGGILIAVAGLCGQFADRESNWWRVASPETAELLWQVGIALLAGLIFAAVLGYLYRGGRSWKVAASAVASVLLLAAAWEPIRFRPVIEQVVHPAGSAVDLSGASYQVQAQSVFETPHISSSGSYSTHIQSKPPYLNGAEERFWFIRGNFEIEGIDPELSYAASLLDARWIAPDGMVLPYDPPKEAFSNPFPIKKTFRPLQPSRPTDARLDTLFGPMPENASRSGHNGITTTLLFGAWTSGYERYRDAPGRLELRVRVDFYQYELAASFPLAEVGKTVHLGGWPLRHVGYSTQGETLEVLMIGLRGAKRWQLPNEAGGSSGAKWMLLNPETGRRSYPSGSGRGPEGVVAASVSGIRIQKEFNASYNRFGMQMPELSDPEALTLVRIDPRYLGSTEVAIVVEDFPLVTEESIEWAENDDQRNR